MGQVYRARDSRLNRDVAIKVSSEQFSERFEREARAIAATTRLPIWRPTLDWIVSAPIRALKNSIARRTT